MLKIGTQTKNVVCDENPEDGFQLLKKCGFDCCDFSLNSYLTNTDLYKEKLNTFFDKTDSELERFFTPHKIESAAAGINISQMHMPYPNFIPNGGKELNDYLQNIVSMKTYKNPDDADECISAGIEELIIKWKKFDMEKKNPFSYFTTVATFAITNTWNKLHGGKYPTISIDNFTNRF